MAQLKFTKTELRLQQHKLGQLQKYLPTLQLKKAMLQMEVNHAHLEIERFMLEFKTSEDQVARYAALFSDRYAFELFGAVKIHEVQKTYENTAGVDIPLFGGITFESDSYALFDTPVWLESAVDGLKDLLILREKIKIAHEKKAALEKELREVSIRVNLFEKIMIPRAQDNIKRIKIFLGDQQLAAVSQAKVSKKKILIREQQHDY